MSVILKDIHKNDPFINALNTLLFDQYGANFGEKFNSWNGLQYVADYVNYDPEGLSQAIGWKRPVTKEQLSSKFFWFSHGEFWFKLSVGQTVTLARDAVAVCKWIENTNGKFIDKLASANFSNTIVSKYLNPEFIDAGYDLSELWKLPKVP